MTMVVVWIRRLGGVLIDHLDSVWVGVWVVFRLGFGWQLGHHLNRHLGGN